LTLAVYELFCVYKKDEVKYTEFFLGVKGVKLWIGVVDMLYEF
jgi:hypothetical protein